MVRSGLGLFRAPAPRGRAAAALGLAAAAGALGLLPGTAGACDPVACLAWLALLAPAAGFACGSSGARLVPYGLSVPALWSLAVVVADARSERDLASPLGGAALVAGLFAAGLGVGARLPERALRGAGLAP